MHQDQPLSGVKIIKLVNGEDVVTILPTGKNQLPDNSQLVRLEKPLLIKYVPQMTMTGFKAVSYTHLTLPTILRV